MCSGNKGYIIDMNNMHIIFIKLYECKSSFITLVHFLGPKGLCCEFVLALERGTFLILTFIFVFYNQIVSQNVLKDE